MNYFLRGLIFLLPVLPLAANPIEATFVGVNGQIGFGYYVGPYYGALDQQSVVLDCIDFANDVSFGQRWAANLSHIDTPGDLANTRYGGKVNALQLYQEAAWLTQQYALNAPSAYGDIQATIWQLFDSYAPTPSSSYWLDQAQANYMYGNYANFFVVTNMPPVNPTGQIQEFLTDLNPNMTIYPQAAPGTLSTPEPRLMGILGLGLIFLAVLLGRLRQSSP